ncbi:MAG: glycosyltransferase family 2 protein [Magnetococcales bacterium]|nr:glycosyltransferase family 2 protein [Magnetococcales bacterium]
MEKRALNHHTLFSIVIPLFNEEEVLDALFERLTALVARLPVRAEVILVNDGSRDRTLEIATRRVLADPVFRLVDLSRNFGHQMAVSAALSLVRGQVVAILDADLQDPPELLLPMLERWSAGIDVVYGQRRQRKGETPFKKLSASIFYRILTHLSSTDIPRDTGDFRVMDRKVVDALVKMPEHRRFLRGMIAWLGFRQEAFLYDREPRAAGETKYPLRKMIRFSLDGIFSFSMKPLRWMAILGFWMTLFGFLWVLFWVVTRLLFPEIFLPGIATTLATIGLLFGINFFFLGILGEYIGLIFLNVQGRPHFIIREVICAAAEEASPPDGNTHELL